LESYAENIRKEWDTLRPHDVLLLLGIHMKENSAESSDFKTAHGVKYVRGCEIIALLDEEGNPIEEFNHEGAAKAFILNQENKFKQAHSDVLRPSIHARLRLKDPGTKRTYRVLLDVNQYAVDLVKEGIDTYKEGTSAFNAVMRRKPQENNFKPVLETIRDLIRTSEVVIPPWLHDIFLGYGDPSSAHYKNMDANHIVQSLDFRDTFLDWDHLVSSFPEKVCDTR
jgi:intron-binding protein aquarius